MSTLENSNYYNSLVSSTDGLNVRAELKASSYFFINGTFSQTIKFGVKSNDSLIFNASNQVNCSGDIYTLCKGQILIQPQTGDAGKINLILKPFNQPINGIPIKYIIYRGLNKIDFITNDNKIAGNENVGSGFCQFIWKEFNQYYASLETVKPDFIADFIGYPSSTNSQELTNLIDSFFHKVTTYTASQVEEKSTAYELPMIPAGTQLGKLNNQDLSIDIILNEGDYLLENSLHLFCLDLDFARKAKTEFNLSNYNEYQQKLIKQTATQFLDLAAFYGLHANGKSSLFIGGTTEQNLVEPTAIYNKIKPFLTKNTQYIYVKSNRGRYYNFYDNQNVENFTGDIKKGTTVTNLVNTSFLDKNWPIHCIEDKTTKNCYFQFTTDNLSQSSLFLKTGRFTTDTQQEVGFLRNDNLLQQNIEVTDTERNLTLPIGLEFTQAAGENIASIIEIIYQGKQIYPKDNVTENSFIQLNAMDDVFGLINAVPFTKKNNDNELFALRDTSLQLMHFTNAQGSTDIATIETSWTQDRIKITEDEFLDRLTYETYTIDLCNQATPYLSSIAVEKNNTATSVNSYDQTRNNYYQPQSPYQLVPKIFTDNGTTVTGLTLETTNGQLPAKKFLGVTKDENQVLIDLINNNQLNNARIGFKNTLDDESSYFTSPEGLQYRTYRLFVIGETQDNDLKSYQPTTDVLVYTLDQLVYSSDKYGKYVESNKTQIELILTENKPIYE